jgi:type IV pilus assembly protein PilW
MKSEIKNMDLPWDAGGFTLIELLVAVAISSIALLMVTQVFISTNKMNTIQEQVASVQQDIRAAMDIISTDIMMAGLDPEGSAGAGFTDNGDDDDDPINNNTDSNSIAMTYDYNGDGTIDDNKVNGSSDVNRCYYYDSATSRLMIRNIKTSGADDVQPLTQDGTITTVNFSYTLANDSVAANPAGINLANIRLVTVQICGKITGAYAADHPKTYCFSRAIKPRNL